MQSIDTQNFTAYKQPNYLDQIQECLKRDQGVTRQEIDEATFQLAECIYNSVKNETQAYTYSNDSSTNAINEINEYQEPQLNIEIKNEYKIERFGSDFIPLAAQETGDRLPVVQDSSNGRQDFFGNQQRSDIPNFENLNFAFEPLRTQYSQPQPEFGFTYIPTSNPSYTFEAIGKTESEAELGKLATDEAIDPLSSNEYNSYLSGSSVLTFENMSSMSACPLNYSSHYSASFDSLVLMKTQEIENVFAPNGENSGDFYNSLRPVNATSFPNQFYQRAVFSLDISPNESVGTDRSELFGPVPTNSTKHSFSEVDADSNVQSPQTHSPSFVTKDAKIFKNSEPKIKSRLMKSRNHKCPVCQKVFKRPLSFKIHYSIHTGEREYKCDWLGCGKLFNVKSNMTRHQKVHLRKLGRRR